MEVVEVDDMEEDEDFIRKNKEQGIEEEKRVPRAIATDGRQLKIRGLGSRNSEKSLHSSARTLEIKDQRKC